jgi:hypothetical protein
MTNDELTLLLWTAIALAALILGWWIVIND